MSVISRLNKYSKSISPPLFIFKSANSIILSDHSLSPVSTCFFTPSCSLPFSSASRISASKSFPQCSQLFASSGMVSPHHGQKPFPGSADVGA